MTIEDQVCAPGDPDHSGDASNSLHALNAQTYAYGLFILLLLLIDATPRFYQGDSISYLTTTWQGWLPIERSWSYGLAVNFLLRHTHGFISYIIIQAIVLGLIIGAVRKCFDGFRSWQLAYALTAIALGLDPLLEIYTRFFMTDFLAAACFMMCLLALLALVKPADSDVSMWRPLLIFLVGSIAAIFLRIAYALILELTVLLVGLGCCRRFSLKGWRRMVTCAAIPVLAVGCLVASNALIFAKPFPHEFFANKQTGIGLAAVFAPALERPDFEAAGVAVTEQEFAGMDLGNYHGRWKQIWSADRYLRRLLADKLNATIFDKSVEDAARELVVSAFRRNPLSLAKVYIWNCAEYLTPSSWRAVTEEEMGFPRPLPDQFVTYVNQYTPTKIDASITAFKSPITTAFAWYAPVYPALLSVGILCAAVLSFRPGVRPYAVVLGSGLLADFLAAAFYSIGLYPRFLIAGVFLSYLLIGLAGLNLLPSRTTLRT